MQKHFRETMKLQAFPSSPLRFGLKLSNVEAMVRCIWVVPWSRGTVSHRHEVPRVGHAGNNIKVLIDMQIAASIHDDKTQTFSKFRMQMGS